MPKKIGVREFKQRASEILREVREAGVAYDVTYRGEVIANLVPAPKQEKQLTIEEWDAMMDALADELAASPVAPGYENMDAVAMISEGRDRIESVLQFPSNPRTRKAKR